MTQRLSIWLLPEAALQRELAAQILRIATALGSPPFQPHVTLIGDFRMDRIAAERLLPKLTASLPSMMLTPSGIGLGASRFEALTVRFRSSRSFDDLVSLLTSGLALRAAAPDAHLSLAYPLAPSEPGSLRSLASGVPLGAPYLFDAIALVDPGAARDDWEDVSAWRQSPSLRLCPCAT